jgi:hypothetical protein
VITLEVLTGKRLDNMSASFADRNFLEELTSILMNALDTEQASAVAAQLVRTFDPAPGSRPGVRVWSEAVAELLWTRPETLAAAKLRQ